MTKRLEGNLLRKLAAALLLAGALLTVGAGVATADEGGSDCAECPTPPDDHDPGPSPGHPDPYPMPPHQPDRPHQPGPSHQGRTYPVPPPATPPGSPDTSDRPGRPPVLPRTGSSTAPLAAAGVGAVATGAGLVVLARRRRITVDA